MNFFEVILRAIFPGFQTDTALNEFHLGIAQLSSTVYLLDNMITFNLNRIPV